MAAVMASVSFLAFAPDPAQTATCLSSSSIPSRPDESPAEVDCQAAVVDGSW